MANILEFFMIIYYLYGITGAIGCDAIFLTPDEIEGSGNTQALLRESGVWFGSSQAQNVAYRFKPDVRVKYVQVKRYLLDAEAVGVTVLGSATSAGGSWSQNFDDTQSDTVTFLFSNVETNMVSFYFLNRVTKTGFPQIYHAYVFGCYVTTSPTSSPTTVAPTNVPSNLPTPSPTLPPVTILPTKTPSIAPTTSPTDSPTTASLSEVPSTMPTSSPTVPPSTVTLSHSPSTRPTLSPTVTPTTVVQASGSAGFLHNFGLMESLLIVIALLLVCLVLLFIRYMKVMKINKISKVVECIEDGLQVTDDNL